MTLKTNLNSIIDSMGEFSNRTHIISINAAIQASKIGGAQGAAFGVLVKEIQQMNEQSIHKIDELNALIKDVSLLSNLINVTGSQRMLLMKMFNALLLGKEALLQESKKRFLDNWETIAQASINTPETKRMIDTIVKKCNQIDNCLELEDRNETLDHVNEIIDQINSLIHLYEDYSAL